MRKLLIWAAVAFAIYMIATKPAFSAQAVHATAHLLTQAAASMATFVHDLI